MSIAASTRPVRRFTSTRMRDDRILVACVTALGLFVVVAFIRDCSLALVRLPLNPREGWNAYHAMSAFGGELYPRFPSMMYDNYPPLSFLVVGGLGKFIGDNIFAGRIVALASTAVTALCVGTISRLMGCRTLEAALTVLLFLANPWLLSDFARIDDPQMLGQAIGCAGFALLVGKSARGTAAGALLLTAACFVKPIFVIQPLALAIWFAIYQPRKAMRFAAYLTLFGALGIIAAEFAFGPTFISHLASARVYDLSGTIAHPGTWLLTGAVPFAASLYLFRYSRDPYAQLCALYAVIAFAAGLFFSGGEGVGGNAMFDASIAAALGLGVLVNRIRKGAAAPEWLGPGAAIAVALGAAVPATLGLAASASASIIPAQPAALMSSEPLSANREIFRADIEFLGKRPGTVLCETLSLCYWAGKTPQVDAFNLSQAFKRHSRSDADLIRLLDTQYFGTIELDRRSHFGDSARLRCAFARNYQLHHADKFGVFLVTRQKAGAGLPSATACSSDFDQFLIGHMV
jgi:hypothetical protein